MKVLQIILGVLVAIAGVYCCTYPVATQVSLAGVFVIVMGIGMLVGGIGEILSWNAARKVGLSSGWTLLSGIVSIILGIVLLGCDFLASGIVMATFLSYLLCIWLIVGGISRIVVALDMRKLASTPGFRYQGASSGWVFVLILGILMIIAGICCFGSPIVLVSFMGIVFGISIIVAGISLIGLAVASPAEQRELHESWERSESVLKKVDGTYEQI